MFTPDAAGSVVALSTVFGLQDEQDMEFASSVSPNSGLPLDRLCLEACAPPSFDKAGDSNDVDGREVTSTRGLQVEV